MQQAQTHPTEDGKDTRTYSPLLEEGFPKARISHSLRLDSAVRNDTRTHVHTRQYRDTPGPKLALLPTEPRRKPLRFSGPGNFIRFWPRFATLN